jgi:hypothetical protein
VTTYFTWAAQQPARDIYDLSRTGERKAYKPRPTDTVEWVEVPTFNALFCTAARAGKFSLSFHRPRYGVEVVPGSDVYMRSPFPSTGRRGLT